MQQLDIDYKLIKSDGIIELRFNRHFDQTEIATIAELLIQRITSARIIEHVEGVDRECFRLDINSIELSLNFEIYSQSCWFEAMTDTDDFALEQLAEYL